MHTSVPTQSLHGGMGPVSPVQSAAGPEPGVLRTPLSLQRAALLTDGLGNRRFYSMRQRKNSQAALLQLSSRILPDVSILGSCSDRLSLGSARGVQCGTGANQRATMPSLLREGCSWNVICFPGCALCSLMMGGKSLKLSQIRSHATVVLGGDWGRGDSSAFSPAPENRVSREVGGDQGNGQAQPCFGSWMKNKRVN